MTRILVIDDDAQIRSILKEMLEGAGYDVIEAPDGEIGLKLFRENPLDLIIMDIVMPKKDGIDVIAELQHDFPDVKIIAISGGGFLKKEDYLQKADELGAVRSLSKPFNIKKLLKTVKELLLK